MASNSRSRLEINFVRLLEETQQMANGSKQKDWTFEKWMEGRGLVVLYGSETGTAQELAERIGREALRHYLMPVVSAMDDYPLDRLLCQPVVVFVASTTGQGEDPHNMKSFFKTLWTQRKNKKLLSRLKFGVIGLGDSSYQKFNYAAKRLNNLLAFLGGEALLKVGLGDDQHDLGPDFVIDPWLKSWWGKMAELYPLPEGIMPLDASLILPSKYKLVFDTQTEIASNTQDSTALKPAGEASPACPCLAEVTMTKRVTAGDHFQDVRLIEFDVTDITNKHKPGDVLMVQPQNLEEHVEEFLSILGLDPEQSFYLELNNPNVTLPLPSVLPRPCTMRQCVQRHFDIQAVPNRYFFELLASFSEDENEKEKLQEFSSAEGQQALYDYCNRPKRSIMEVLADFPNTKNRIPLDYLFDIVPAIKPRPYSIASSALAIPNKAQLLIAVVKYNTVLHRPRLGLCTNWLSRQKVGDKVPVWIKPGTLTFPSPSTDLMAPVLLIGPGTGCAPFRAYIQERVACGMSKGTVLVFGCRNKNKDYFFEDEWETLVKEDKLKLYCAFSRDQENKVYVQHVMREHWPSFWKLIDDQSSRLYFAGNAKRVPIDVYEALTYICEQGRGQGTPDAEQYMKTSVEKRYQTETWA